jgi:phage baseplate assembly protein gpV
MAFKIYESGEPERPAAGGGSAIATGTVVDNFDLLSAGKVLVSLPAIDEEVLVAMIEGSPADAYVLGGLWSAHDKPPVTDPLEAPAKRVLRTGLTSGTGHEVEFDDLEQSITITTSTKQKIAIEPEKIEIANTAGTLTITLDNATQTVTVSGVKVEIEAQAELTLKGTRVSIEATAELSASAQGDCSISGLPGRIN